MVKLFQIWPPRVTLIDSTSKPREAAEGGELEDLQAEMELGLGEGDLGAACALSHTPLGRRSKVQILKACSRSMLP